MVVNLTTTVVKLAITSVAKYQNYNGIHVFLESEEVFEKCISSFFITMTPYDTVFASSIVHKTTYSTHTHTVT